jgi:outer membrane protein OmpA-like peptidoglycan-associated protein
LPIKGKPGKSAHVCVNGVVTWTPGDVVVAEKRGGLVSIASTKEYASQMPNVLIGIQPFMQQHPQLVTGMISAILKGGSSVKLSSEALQRGAEVSDEVYQEPDTGPAYWLKYFNAHTQRDRQGLSVELGGSKVNDLGDNVVLFGLRPGYANAFEATYTTFGKIVHDQYPADVPSFPAASAVVNTSYLRQLLDSSREPVEARVETASYLAVSSSESATQLGRRSWQIQFDSGRDTFRPEAQAQLTELMQGLVVAAGAAVEIHGHTDNQGAREANQALSERRAFAVKAWLSQRAPENFPEARFRVFAHGAEQPRVPNDSELSRSQNRRVDIVLVSR